MNKLEIELDLLAKKQVELIEELYFSHVKYAGGIDIDIFKCVILKVVEMCIDSTHEKYVDHVEGLRNHK